MDHLTEDFELRGTWWLPEKPRKRIQGTLRFTSAEGAFLDLEGSFETGDDIVFMETEIILGLNTQRTIPVTLYKCHQTKIGVNSSGLLNSSFKIELFLLGVHIEKAADIKFNKVSVRYTRLDDWAGFSGVRTKRRGEKLFIEYEPPESVSAICSSGCRISISAGSVVENRRNEVTIREEASVNIVSTEGKSFDEYWRIMQQIRVFLSLAAREQVSPVAIWGGTEAAKHRIGNGGTYYLPIKIFRHVSLKASRPLENTRRHDFLFRLSDVKLDFDSCMRNWLDRAELLDPVYNLYFIVLGPGVVLENKFLFIIQAIEAYHRRTTERVEWSKEENEGLVNKIVNQIDEDKRERIRQRLERAYELFLRERLKDIFDMFSGVLPMPGPKFFNSVLNTRNYLVHWDKELERKAAKGEELWTRTWDLRILLEICLLKELGLSLDRIRELIFPKSGRHKILPDL